MFPIKLLILVGGTKFRFWKYRQLLMVIRFNWAAVRCINKINFKRLTSIVFVSLRMNVCRFVLQVRNNKLKELQWYKTTNRCLFFTSYLTSVLKTIILGSCVVLSVIGYSISLFSKLMDKVPESVVNCVCTYL